ncbi:vasotab-like [Anabrus simplex]|uniref:vasotab-like n=1 Tax=Anabrus simplex TaxID=316456 RepID=UPI0035A34A78
MGSGNQRHDNILTLEQNISQVFIYTEKLTTRLQEEIKMSLKIVLLLVLIVIVAEAKECAKSCPTRHEPICARQGSSGKKTFGNQCELDRYNCKYGTSLRKIKSGSC